MPLMICPSCHREYDQGFLKCPYDGAALVDASSEQHDPFIGLQLANTYQLVRRIGAGGMGAVYEARHVRLDTPFAVKVLYPELSLNAELLARFHREARSASQLRHPNILDVFDVNSTEDGVHYIVEEFLEGTPLSGLLEQQPIMSLERGIPILEQVCDAMAAAHVKSIIHRDLKPENIFLVEKEGKTDFVKVLDFGIAKMQEEGKAQLTQAAQVMGTPDYISPEQAMNAKDADGRSDVYSLGVVIYRMFTGRLPYEISNPALALAAVTGQPSTPPRQRRPDLPADIEAVILKSTARDPNQRYNTMEQLKRALQDLLAHGARKDPSLPQTVYSPASLVTGPPSPPTVASVTGPSSPPPQMTPVTGPGVQHAQVHTTPVVGQVQQAPSGKKLPIAAILGGVVGLVVIGGIVTYLLIPRDDKPSGDPAKKDSGAVARDAGAKPPPKDSAPTPEPDTKPARAKVRGMVLLEGGAFTVGRADGVPLERPTHKCTVADFYLDAKEVTRGDFARFLASAAGKKLKPHKEWKTFGAAPKLPAAFVSWDDARAYCASVGKRLPTEAEWEYAARGEDHKQLYPGGSPPGREHANTCAAKGTCKGIKPRAASKPQNGFSDLIGNVGEWVQDAFGGYTDACHKRTKPPKKHRHGGKWTKMRSIRGGSVAEYKPSQLTATYRFYYFSTLRDGTVGFRCAKDAR